LNKYFPVIKKIRLNEIAFKRINAERAAKGQGQLSKAGLDIAPLGQEAVFSATADAGASASGTGDTGLPGSVDNSALPAFPPIRSQGSIASCTAWATTYYQYTYETNLARGRTASDGNNNNIFSPKWTYDFLNGGTNTGTAFSSAFAIELNQGAVTWSEFPYDTNYLQWCLNSTAWRNALDYRPASYGQIYNSDPAVLMSSIKSQLANGHLVVIGTYVNSWTQGRVGNDLSTTLDDSFVNQYIATYVKNTNLGGHAMTVVGYNDNLWCDLNGNGLVDSGEKGAFKIANSWGTGDWNGGYRWITYDSLRGTSAVASSSTWPAADRSLNGILWSGSVYTLTASASYSPSLVAAVTLNTANRGQMMASLGTGTTTSTQPSATWLSKALNYSGGSYAFNGTTTACDGTFYLDFSSLAGASSGNTRWFSGINDNTAGNSATLKSYNLYNVTGAGDVLLASSTNLPRTVDASQAYTWVDYMLNVANQPPAAVITASATSGNIPFIASFNASQSVDPDGTIAAYTWNFGDGSSASGSAVTHTFTAAGTYSVSLTVTDNQGAMSAAKVTISAIDPYVLNAPSGLSSAVSGKVVSLKWTDNSNNETGFYIERAVKIGAGYTYARVGTVSAGVTVFTETLTSNSYQYRIQAFNINTGKASGYSNTLALRIK